jgi:hypothetical protein
MLRQDRPIASAIMVPAPARRATYGSRDLQSRIHRAVQPDGEVLHERLVEDRGGSLPEEIAQDVFGQLARGAPPVAPGVPVGRMKQRGA